jgi:DnaJ domain
MLSGSSNILLSLFGWSFIPDFATRQILNLFYNFVYSKSPIRTITAPTPGSLQYRKHYAIIFAAVILTYLNYTLVYAARTMQPNFYQILGVAPNVDDNGLKLAFRAFAKRNHPDRPEVGREGEALFMAVRDAFEALKDPVVRFAYDRCVTTGRLDWG